MNKNLLKFGKILKELRLKYQFSLRDVCKHLNYDPSNWSKIERGIISPPSDEETLYKWAKFLALIKKEDIHNFIDSAMLAQGIIPKDILNSNSIKLLPAFLRTLRNKKPTKQEIDKMLELIKNS